MQLGICIRQAFPPSLEPGGAEPKHHGSMAFLFGQAWASQSFCGVLWHGHLSWPEDTDSKDEPVRRHHTSISDAHVLMTVLFPAPKRRMFHSFRPDGLAGGNFCCFFFLREHMVHQQLIFYKKNCGTLKLSSSLTLR